MSAAPESRPDSGDEAVLNAHFFRSTGLLWKINHDILHPIGLALAVGVHGPDEGGKQ